MSYRVTVEQLDGRPVSVHGLETGELVVGRSDDCDVPLASTDVSRRHARLFIHLGRCYVEDLGSANGVIVDAERISGIVQLAETSLVMVGSFVVRVERADPGRGTAIRTTPTPKVASAPLTFRPTLAARIPGERPLLFALVEQHVVVGRGRASTVLLAHPSVSRQHASIQLQADAWVLDDLNSANGTEVNGHLVDRPTTLREGDRIRFGDVYAVYTRFPDQLDSSDLATLGPKRSPQVATWMLAVAGLLIIASLGLLGWAFTSDNDEASPIAPPDLRAQLADELESGSWTSAQRIAEQMRIVDPSNAVAVDALARIEREVDASTALEACEGLMERAQQAETAGDVDNALARSLEATSCLHAVTTGTRAAEDATRLQNTRVTPRLIGLQRRAGALALTQQNAAVAVQHLRAAHERASTALDADVSSLEPAIRRELRAARIAAASADMQAERWSAASEQYRQAGALGALSALERRQLAEAEAAARTDDKP